MMKSIQVNGLRTYKMKKSILIFSCLILNFIGFAQNSRPRQIKVPIDSTTSNLGYLRYVPVDYESTTDKLFPLLIFIHGVNEAGNGSKEDLDLVYDFGIPKVIWQNDWPVEDINSNQSEEDFVVLSPQYSDTVSFASPSEIKNFIDYAVNAYKVDINRVYITGISSGGISVYNYLAEYQNQVAAAVVMAGGAADSTLNKACNIKLPVWAFHGAEDRTILPEIGENIITAINSCEPPPKYRAKFTLFEGIKHGAWFPGYDLIYNIALPDYDPYNMNVYNWMLQFSLNDAKIQRMIIDQPYLLDQKYEVKNLVVKSTGSLSFDTDITIEIEENLDVDGAIIDSTGTIHMISSSDNIQRITGNANSVSLNNLMVTNNGTGGVLNESNINLNNTFYLEENSFFDADGVLDTAEFRMMCNSRIAPLGDNSILKGHIGWYYDLASVISGYYHMGFPIKNQSLASLSDDLYFQGISENKPDAWTNISYYDETLDTNGASGWVPFISETDALQIGMGFSTWQWDSSLVQNNQIFIKGPPVLGNAGDSLNLANETFTFPISFTPSSFQGGGWNFVANPYPSEINWDKVDQSSLAGSAYYLWDPVSFNYKVYSATTGAGSLDISEMIRAGQGFFVKAENNSAQLQIQETDKFIPGETNSLRYQEISIPKLMIQFSSKKNQDEAVIVIHPEASDAYDPLYDAVKLKSGSVILSTYLSNGQELAINAINSTLENRLININLSASSSGLHSLRFPSISDMNGAKYLLIDHLLDSIINISEETNYAFHIDKYDSNTFGKDRFDVKILMPFDLEVRPSKSFLNKGSGFKISVFSNITSDKFSTNLSINWDTLYVAFDSLYANGVLEKESFDLEFVESGEIYYQDSQFISMSNFEKDTILLFELMLRLKNPCSNDSVKISVDESKTYFLDINRISIPYKTKPAKIKLKNEVLLGGKINNSGDNSIAGVKITAKNDKDTIISYSDEEGLFNLNLVRCNDYTIYAKPPEDWPVLKFVDIVDAVKLWEYIQSPSIDLNPYQLVAMDVDTSRTVSTDDLQDLCAVLLRLQESFASGINWLYFFDDWGNYDNPLKYELNSEIGIDSDSLMLTLRGVKVGDVDQSSLLSSVQTPYIWNVQFGAPLISNGKVKIPLNSLEEIDIKGIQFSLSWNEAKMTFINIESEFEYTMINKSDSLNHELTFLGLKSLENKIKIAKGEPIFCLVFNKLEGISNQKILFNDKMNAIAVDDRDAIVEIRQKPSSNDFDSYNGLILYQNTPNPFINRTKINFYLPSNGKVEFQIISLLGEIVYQNEKNFDPGLNSIEIDEHECSNWDSGIYFIKIESNYGNKTIRMIKL